MGSIPVSHEICFCFSSFVGLLFSLYVRKHRSFFPISSLPHDSTASCAKVDERKLFCFVHNKWMQIQIQNCFSYKSNKKTEMKSQLRQKTTAFLLSQSINQSSNREAKEDLLQSVFLALFYFSMSSDISRLVSLTRSY